MVRREHIDWKHHRTFQHPTGDFVPYSDFDRLATLARELATYIAAHGDKHHLPIQLYVLAKDILNELGEVPHEP
jgi:hypothetical protein